jgi:cobalt-zinc-cadmium efflux system membrane fusion protein
MSGIVVERNANPGQEVRPDQAQPGAPALFVVSDPTHLWAQLDAPEAAAGSLKVGSKITLRTPAAPEGKVEGRIEQVADFLDPQSRTVKIRVGVDNRSRVLKADSFVSAEAEVDRGNFISVPATAVYLNGETQYVFIDEGERKYRRAEVKAEEAGFGRMRVRSGVQAGQSVVVDGGLLLQQIFAAAPSKPQADAPASPK